MTIIHGEICRYMVLHNRPHTTSLEGDLGRAEAHSGSSTKLSQTGWNIELQTAVQRKVRTMAFASVTMAIISVTERKRVT